jgi:hypothetical protein
VAAGGVEEEVVGDAGGVEGFVIGLAAGVVGGVVVGVDEEGWGDGGGEVEVWGGAAVWGGEVGWVDEDGEVRAATDAVDGVGGRVGTGWIRRGVWRDGRRVGIRGTGRGRLV